MKKRVDQTMIFLHLLRAGLIDSDEFWASVPDLTPDHDETNDSESDRYIATLTIDGWEE